MSVEPQAAVGTIEALLVEERRFPPPPALAEHANAQPGIYAEADRDYEAFWAKWARTLEWSRPFTRTLEWNLPFARWFSELSQDEQINDIRSAIKLAGELPSLFKVGGVYSLADFGRRGAEPRRVRLPKAIAASIPSWPVTGASVNRDQPAGRPGCEVPITGEQIERGEA